MYLLSGEILIVTTGGSTSYWLSWLILGNSINGPTRVPKVPVNDLYQAENLFHIQSRTKNPPWNVGSQSIIWRVCVDHLILLFSLGSWWTWTTTSSSITPTRTPSSCPSRRRQTHYASLFQRFDRSFPAFNNRHIVSTMTRNKKS